MFFVTHNSALREASLLLFYSFSGCYAVEFELCQDGFKRFVLHW